MELFLRTVNESDIDLIYRWSNDPITRKESFNQMPISYENHCKWFDETLKNPCIGFYVMMVNDLPVGQIRANIKDNKAQISYSVAAEYRGKGYGKKIIELGVERICSDYPMVTSIVAEVKANNIASAKCFLVNGFSKVYEVYELRDKLNDDIKIDD